ncbi:MULTISPECIES: DedA family protein [Deinococcus]|uniref:DedA family protein n=1 Tax=Deinococcus rufus TaxID=2136097 RepID=A0ABV7Z665_9DEIO|nr:DedA family protein [Deinococcus sp. AB2017081]WQE97204.1 DedA family protein [Deinococcus sp. AB2017081]
MNLRLWLGDLDPLVLNLVTFALLSLEGAGIPGIPGVIPMVAQVAMIDAGHTTLLSAVLWGVLGNWLGSALGYALGRWGGQRLPARWRAAVQSERNVALLARWGAPLIVVSRTVGSLRTPVTLLAGMTAYPWPKYLALSLLGAVLHVGVWQTLLWRFGPALLPVLEQRGREVLLGVTALAALALALRWWRGWRTPVDAPPA